MATVAAVEFSADRTTIRPGECVTFTWKVEGVKEVYFYADGERWQDHGVVGVGQQEVCPPHTTTYNLRVVQQDDAVRDRQIQITVQEGMEAVDFSVDRTTISPGECVTFTWRVEGVKEVYFYSTGERWQDCGVAGVSQQEECPAKSDTYTLKIVKQDDSTIDRQIKITVKDGPTSGRPEPIPL